MDNDHTQDAYKDTKNKHDVRGKINFIAIVGKTCVGRTTGPMLAACPVSEPVKLDRSAGLRNKAAVL